MSTHINWGIIGCGNVTEVKSGPAFNKVPNSSLKAVMRRNGLKAADYAQRHGVPKWYDDAYQLINDPEVNAIYVATPPSSHEEYTLASLAAGKPVYLEKPMALNRLSCDKITAAAQRQQIKLSVAHYRRQLPFFKYIKTLLEEQAVGVIRFVSIRMQQSMAKNVIPQTEENWRTDPAVSGGGLFHDLAPHQLDLMCYYFGAAKSVSGIATNRAGLYKADDLVTGQIKFESGLVMNGIWCFTVNEADVRDVCEIVGSEGSIRFPFFGGTNIEVITNGQKVVHNIPYPAHVQQPMIEQVVQFFLGNVPNPCPPEEAAEIMGWMDKMTNRTD